MNAVLSLALPFFGLILLGYLAVKISKKEPAGTDWLTIFVVYFTVPALLFSLLSKAPVEELGNITFIVTTTTSTLLVFVLSLLLSLSFYRVGLAASALRASAASYSNSGYMGVPLAIGALGVKAAVPATLIVCFDSLLIFMLVPVFVAFGLPDKQGLRSVLRDITNRILLNPLIIGCIAGILAAYFSYTPPSAIVRIIDYLSVAAAPCALFALGVTVASRPAKSASTGIAPNILFKLFIHPLVVVAALMLVGITGVWLKTAILVAALPTALGVYVIANQAERETDNVSSTILFSTMLSVITVTSILYIFELDLLP